MPSMLVFYLLDKTDNTKLSQNVRTASVATSQESLLILDQAHTRVLQMKCILLGHGKPSDGVWADEVASTCMHLIANHSTMTSLTPTQETGVKSLEDFLRVDWAQVLRFK